MGTKGRRRANGEGSISKRKDGRWEGRYTVETALGSRRRAVYGKTRGEVAKKLAAAPREETSSMDPNLLVKDYLKGWLEDSVRASVRPTTFSRYESLVRLHINPGLGGTRLLKLTPTKVQALYRERLDSGCSPRTVQYVHVTLHKALDQAIKWQMVSANVTEAVTVPRVTKEEVRPLSPAQVKVFLKAVRGERLEPMFTLAVTTGMRQGELLGLKWEDVDLDASRTSETTGPRAPTGRPATSSGRTGSLKEEGPEPGEDLLKRIIALPDRDELAAVSDVEAWKSRTAVAGSPGEVPPQSGRVGRSTRCSYLLVYIRCPREKGTEEGASTCRT